MYVTLILFGGGIFLTLGDIVFKYWTGHESWPLYVLGMALYVCGLVPLIESYKYENIELASALLVIFNIFILTIVGWLYFHEKIGWLEVLGLLFAAAAILCLELAS
jgi:multidrug transporter EmrE-like cation transporter